MEKHDVFSAHSRTEISGNHTDHQCGCVLAAAVNLETVADVRLNGTNNIRVQSERYPTIKVDLNDLSVHGGGFAGTLQAFVPFEVLEQFETEIVNVLRDGKCHVLNIRSDGGIRVQ